MKATIIIPTMNEEDAIASVIENVPDKYQILVIDNSEDQTAKIARERGVKVIKQESSGKGNAMTQAAEEVDTEIIVFIDGDNSYPGEKIPEIVKEIDGHDIVYGTRRPKNGSMSLSHKIGNFLFKTIASLLYEKTSDLLTGMFAIKKDKFLQLNLKSKGFAIETEIFVKVVKNNLDIKEIEVPYLPRKGESKLNTFEDGIKILKMLLKHKMLKR